MKYNPKLRKGDLEIISEIVGMSVRTVQSTYYGYRNNKKIHRAIDKYVELREDLEEELKSEFNPAR